MQEKGRPSSHHQVDGNKGCKVNFMRCHDTVTAQGLKAQLGQRASQDPIMDIKG